MINIFNDIIEELVEFNDILEKLVESDIESKVDHIKRIWKDKSEEDLKKKCYMMKMILLYNIQHYNRNFNSIFFIMKYIHTIDIILDGYEETIDTYDFNSDPNILYVSIKRYNSNNKFCGVKLSYDGNPFKIFINDFYLNDMDNIYKDNQLWLEVANYIEDLVLTLKEFRKEEYPKIKINFESENDKELFMKNYLKNTIINRLEIV